MEITQVPFSVLFLLPFISSLLTSLVFPAVRRRATSLERDSVLREAVAASSVRPSAVRSAEEIPPSLPRSAGVRKEGRRSEFIGVESNIKKVSDAFTARCAFFLSEDPRLLLKRSVLSVRNKQRKGRIPIEKAGGP